MRRGSALSGRLAVLAAAALFSTGGAVIKAIDLSGWQVASFRSGIAALALLALIPASRRAASWRALGVGVVYAATLVLFVQANKQTTAASAIFLQSSAPFYVLLLSPWLLRERVRRSDLALMAALAVGLALLFVGLDAASPTAPRPLLGNVLGAAAGLTWACTVMGLRALGRAGGPGAAAGAAVLGNALTFLVCLPLALPARGGGAGDWAGVLFLGVVQVGLAYVFLTRAMPRVPAFEASLLLLLEPVLNPIWAWLAHGERPGAWSLAGGALILAATAVKTWLDAGRSSAA
ncbi:MAG TPA: DMT family transporter [Thermoanaerobaculia bacterium]|nr:DMT family transporter [Thermoanaerobaculia bacterium]